MKRARISIEQYAELCGRTDFCPAHHPDIVAWYFARLGRRPKFIGVFDGAGRLVAGHPVLFGMVFPNVLHKRLLRGGERLGDIGQPESLFPVAPGAPRFALNHLSPTTSPLLGPTVRGFRDWSIRAVSIAKRTRHKEATRSRRLLFEQGGRVIFADEMPAADFAEAYVGLHSRRWNYPPEKLAPVRQQIVGLHQHVHGGVLLRGDEVLAAQFCLKSTGGEMFYVDFVNIGVVPERDKRLSFGSVMMLSTLQRAEEIAQSLGKRLRFSFGHQIGRSYKSLWADPEPTFVGF